MTRKCYVTVFWFNFILFDLFSFSNPLHTLPYSKTKEVKLVPQTRTDEIRHFRNEKGTRAEMRPAIVSGITNSPRSHCERSHGLDSLSFLKWRIREENTVEHTVHPVSDHPKCNDWVVAYGRWSFTGIEPRDTSSEKRSRHICFMEDNLLHAMSKLRHV